MGELFPKIHHIPLATTVKLGRITLLPVHRILLHRGRVSSARQRLRDRQSVKKAIAKHIKKEDSMLDPTVLFGIQFTLSLIAYALIAVWYVAPALSGLPREAALIPLLFVHVFRIAGGTILAPGAVAADVPSDFRVMIGYGDLATAVLALLAVIALRSKFPGAVALVWLCLIVGTADTVNAIIQSERFSVFTYSLGVNWVIVTLYVPALLVSSILIFLQLVRRSQPKSK
jgi:hypothetical protein